MASNSAVSAVHATLTANTVDTATLSQDLLDEVTVLNRTGTAEIWVTVGTAANPPADPAVGGDNCWVLPAAICSRTISLGTPGCIVKLKSTGTPSYSVESI